MRGGGGSEHAGFVGVRRRDFDSERDSVPRWDGSLAVEAAKPEAHGRVLRAPRRQPAKAGAELQ